MHHFPGRFKELKGSKFDDWKVLTEYIQGDYDRISGVVALLDMQWPKIYIATLVPLEAILLVPVAFLLCKRITSNLESMEDVSFQFSNGIQALPDLKTKMYQ